MPTRGVINNITAPDQYADYATLDGLPITVAYMNLTVLNAAIFIQLKTAEKGDPSSGRASQWQAEVFQVPGGRTVTRQGFVGIRFRAAVLAANLPAGAMQAQVTIEAVQP